LTVNQIISCRNVTLKYGAVVAVKNVSFDLHHKDYLCVVGENGSGKSTLLKGMLGLAKPVHGQIAFCGVNQDEIGYLPQQTVHQTDFPASVYEVVLSGCLNRRKLFPFYSRKDKDCAYQNLGRLGIESLVNKSYCDLSGGQQQRVLLARALCATKKLLVLDEPVTGLDPTGTAELYGLLQKLNQESGLAIVTVSHDVKNSIKYANKILHMKTSLLYYGSAADYLQSPVGRKMLGGEEDA